MVYPPPCRPHRRPTHSWSADALIVSQAWLFDDKLGVSGICLNLPTAIGASQDPVQYLAFGFGVTSASEFLRLNLVGLGKLSLQPEHRL